MTLVDNRHDICLTFYTTEFSRQNLYTVKLRNLRHCSLTSRNALYINYLFSSKYNFCRNLHCWQKFTLSPVVLVAKKLNWFFSCFGESSVFEQKQTGHSTSDQTETEFRWASGSGLFLDSAPLWLLPCIGVMNPILQIQPQNKTFSCRRWRREVEARDIAEYR